MNERLKQWLRENCGLSASATPEQYKRAMGEALVADKLSPAKLAELTGNDPKTTVLAAVRQAVGEAVGGVVPSDQSKALQAMLGEHGVRNHNGGGGNSHSFGMNTAKSVALHKTTKRPCFVDGAPLMTQSQLDLAKIGTFLRYEAQKSGLGHGIRRLDESERALLAQMTEEDDWVGDDGDEIGGRYRGERVKSLLDDSVSGGTALVPEVWDKIVLTPILHSELWPFVAVQTVRGRQINGGILGRMSGSWSSGEGTAAQLVTSAGLVTSFGCALRNFDLHILVGADFLSDAPDTVGAGIQEAMSREWLAEADRVLANGDGALEPEGFFTVAGSNLITSANGAGGPVELSDLESLYYGCGKEYRQLGDTVFCMPDSLYHSFRALPRGALDEQRLNGMDHSSYQLLGQRVAIVNGLPAGRAAFLPLSTLRAYRAGGVQIRMTREGLQLQQSNQILVSLRMRLGIKAVLPPGIAKCTTLQSV